MEKNERVSLCASVTLQVRAPRKMVLRALVFALLPSLLLSPFSPPASPLSLSQLDSSEETLKMWPNKFR